MDGNYDLAELRVILKAHLMRYPLAEVQDAVKLLYQHEMGCAHILGNTERAYRMLREECSSVPELPLPLAVDIGNGLCRINLAALNAHGITPDNVFDWMLATAESMHGDKQRLIASLELLHEDSLHLPFDPAETEAFLREYLQAGCPAVHHSARYAAAYAPAYRVIRAELIKTGVLEQR